MEETNYGKIKELIDRIEKVEDVLEDLRNAARMARDAENTKSCELSNLKIELTKLLNPVLDHSSVRDPNPPIRVSR